MKKVKIKQLTEKNYRSIVKYKNGINQNTIMLGKVLYENQVNKYYKELGYSGFEYFLSSPDVEISRAWAYVSIGIYREFVMKCGVNIERLKKIDVQKLSYAKKIVNKDNVDYYLKKAKKLCRKDFYDILPASYFGSQPKKQKKLSPVHINNRWTTGKLGKMEIDCFIIEILKERRSGLIEGSLFDKKLVDAIKYMASNSMIFI